MDITTKWKQKQHSVIEKQKEKDRAKYRKNYQKNAEKIIAQKSRHYYKKRQELIEELGGRCAFCGQFDNGFNIHHKIPVLELKVNKLYHYLKNKDIMLLLCPDCHIVWHQVMDELKIDDIFKEVQ